MNLNMSGPNGEVTQKQIEHYVTRAANIGLVIVEFTFVSQHGKISSGQLGIHNDGLIAGLRKLVDAIHGADAKVVIQLGHGGSRATKATCGYQPVAPSATIDPDPRHAARMEMPRALSTREIVEIVAGFGEAARRAIEAGFDGVELHGCHGYLLNQFMSPLTNHRDDEYGGDPERRLRFPLDVIHEVKRRLGSSHLLLYRFAGDDFIHGGLTLEQTLNIAPRVENAGVSVVDISGGLGNSGWASPQSRAQGTFIPMAQRIREVVGVPVIGVGNITDPRFADKVVREGRVDMVAIGRALLADANWSTEAAKILGSS
jgi:2,4-dienoyl-CoA reductase-like NADH-dependent reductase (Old Yellow Enzyme family)